MQIILKSIELTNWQGGNGKFEFADITNVSADNGRGKSRLYRAFLYCLFGKDDNGKSDFDVFTIENGEYTKQDATVSCTLSVDGEEQVITVATIQKRDRKGEYKGSTINYYLNNVPFGTKSEYQDYIKSIIDEDMFRAITNPTHFLSLNWKEQRAKLFDLVNVKEEEIEGFESLKGMKLPIDEYKKRLIAEKNKLNKLLGTDKERGEIGIRIEQTSSFIQDESELPTYEQRKKEVEADIALLDKQLQSAGNATLEELQEQILTLEEKKAKAQQDSLQHINNLADQNNSERRRLITEKSQKEDTLKVFQGRLVRQKEVVENLQKELTDARTNYDKERKQEFKSEIKCPLTNEVCTNEKAIAKYNADFIHIQMEKQNELVKSGKELRAKYEQQQGLLIQIQEDIDSYTTAIAELETKISNIPEMPYKTLSDIAPDIAITEQIEQLQSKMATLTSSTYNLVTTKNNLQTELDELNQKLSIKAVNDIYRDEIAKLEEQQAECLNELFAVQAKIDEVDAFNKAKIDLNTAKINSMFDLVQFQLYKDNLVGTSEECCIARNRKGVKIANTNTAEKIQAGLEIIRVLSEKAGVSVPIFIDNRESISTIPQMNCQIINLYKTTDNQIKISYE